MYRYETVATKETGESLWLLQVPVFLPVEEKRWSVESAGIVQSCIRYTNLTIQPYPDTLKSILSSQDSIGNVNTYLEWLKIADAHFSRKTCYTILTRLQNPENRPILSFTRVNKASSRKTLRDRVWFCHNDCHNKRPYFWALVNLAHYEIAKCNKGNTRNHTDGQVPGKSPGIAAL